MNRRLVMLSTVLATSLAAGSTIGQAPSRGATAGNAAPTSGVITAPSSSMRAKCALAPTWRRTETRFGISLGSNGGRSMKQDLDHEEARFHTRVPVVRTWDDRLPTRTPWSEKRKWYGKRWVVTSIRVTPDEVLNGSHDRDLRRYFRTAPRKAPILWNYWHEPEDEIRNGQFTAREYRRAWRHVARIAGSLCRPNLYPTLVLMGWTANRAATPTWRELDPGRRFVSVYAWDPYNGALGDARTYVRPRDLFRPVVRASKKMGRPWAIAETGTVRIPGDGGVGRARWLRKVVSFSRRNDAVFVTYYQSTRNGDFELRTSPELDVWRRAM